ncbi:hypothetical protein ACH35V_32420 [Actinomadura sp. 1N219]|uniref:hypothetical protein n=1 Tax=Actinomadura sp. 1N219 TaxID=3375152 RepID=UPI0037B72E60
MGGQVRRAGGQRERQPAAVGDQGAGGVRGGRGAVGAGHGVQQVQGAGLVQRLQIQVVGSLDSQAGQGPAGGDHDQAAARAGQ